MAGDRHGKHNTTTISFRVNSYEKATIEERVKVKMSFILKENLPDILMNIFILKIWALICI